MTVFFLSLITIVIVAITNHINHHSLVFNMKYAIKTLGMLSIAGLFSFIWSVICLYKDKNKCIKIASSLTWKYNNYNIDSDFEKEPNEKTKYIIEKIDMNRHYYGLMAKLIINDIDIRVKGINIKEMNYYLSCETEYKTGEKCEFKLKFSAINGGDPVLENIIY